jgi:polar amino acid transport system substrate-binding protein
LKRLILLVVYVLLAASAHAHSLRVLTEEWPPFNHLEHGQPSGLAVEMVEALFNESGIKATIEFLPWNRAYNTALDNPDILLFTLGRNADREVLFNWMFRVAPREIWLFHLSERTDIKVVVLNDARKYKIGTGPREDGSTQELLKAGFSAGENLDSVQGNDPDTKNIQKLFQNRIDLLAGNPLSLAYSCKKLGLDFNMLEPSFRLSGDDAGYWVALSRNSDPALVNRLRASAMKLEALGVFKALREKYIR